MPRVEAAIFPDLPDKSHLQIGSGGMDDEQVEQTRALVRELVALNVTGPQIYLKV